MIVAMWIYSFSLIVPPSQADHCWNSITISSDQFEILPFSYVDREIKLGDGKLGVGEGDDITVLPDPWFCNLKFNVIRVLIHASSAADIFRKYSDHADMQLFILGVSAEMDNILLAKLPLIAV